MLLREFVGQHIIDERAVWRRQCGVMRLMGREARDVVGGDALHGVQRIAAGDLELTHVADVEQSGAAADRKMLGGEAGVFDGHVPAAELNHARAERPVPCIERSLLEGAWNCLSHRGNRVAGDRAGAVETQNGTMRLG